MGCALEEGREAYKIKIFGFLVTYSMTIHNHLKVFFLNLLSLPLFPFLLLFINISLTTLQMQACGKDSNAT